ncbi:hypothetical protein RFI_15960 [Reticulomyxa filosa]|uniref:CUE domain-containing protein n=1 Tax=Reticulomyxa filosa TaxID=46433 RepID=X6N654_RETFI|nr:hypothetical protein RFI_15960 [Reticulomyxa filosa]|eukprot:ETO21244.1 hypothetical protein RFI_15960 [Reticulomyxa filosa]
MLAQLKKEFPKIDKGIISEVSNEFNENVEDANDVLVWLTENTTTLQEQQHLLKLLKVFGSLLPKTTISQTWRNYNKIFFDTLEELREICTTFNLNELEEENELKILREICLHILWNIFKYPKHRKYRQINTQTLYNYFFSKCNPLGVNLERIFEEMENFLQQIEFQKGDDNNWYYLRDHIQLHMWYITIFGIKEQTIYKTRYPIPETVCMLSNGKWKEYAIAFDYQHRTIMLFDEKTSKIKSLQVGNPNKSSLEFNVHIQWYNDTDINETHNKWACLILNHTWHFRIFEGNDRDDLSNCISVNESKKKNTSIFIKYQLYNSNDTIEFNSFHVIWKDQFNKTHKEPLNPYSMTLRQGIQHIKDKLQIKDYFTAGPDELICLKYEFDEWMPAISTTNEDVLLHDIYRRLPHYPIIQVHWKIEGYFMVPYKRTISTQRGNLPKSIPLQDSVVASNPKPKFNPLLYERDLHKLKVIRDTINIEVTRSNPLQKLLHEIIKNLCMTDLISKKIRQSKTDEEIKQQINFNENDKDGELILNDKILTILHELKILYHDDIHKRMGYPLQLHQICAILLYCGKSCNVPFSYDQIKLKHHIWPYLDFFLHEAISTLHKYERREEESTELYCGLKNVRLETIKEIKEGFFISHVSTSDDIQVAQMYRSHQGCILHFHPSMRRSHYIHSCDVSWLSPFKHEREILFERSLIYFTNSDKTNKTENAWNAKIESEDEYTQMILLTWIRYDQYIQQIMQISAMWSHSIDLNVLYAILLNTQGEVNLAIKHLSEFEAWRMQPKNKRKYEEIKNEFMEKRCCNNHINLFSFFL